LGLNSSATNGESVVATDSTGIGEEVLATGDYSTGLGNGAWARGEKSTALGRYSQADGLNSTAVGQNAGTTSTSSIALGAHATTNGANQIAIGAAIGSGQEITRLRIPGMGIDWTSNPVADQTGNSGKYLTTDGTTTSWGVIDYANAIMTIMGAY
jgi:hypothetical protein